jgi:hypothetical protein
LKIYHLATLGHSVNQAEVFKKGEKKTRIFSTANSTVQFSFLTMARRLTASSAGMTVQDATFILQPTFRLPTFHLLTFR